MILNSKRSNIAPFLAIDMLSKSNDLKLKGQDIIHMDVGEPGFNTPSHVLKYLESIIQESSYRYTEALGMPKLREAISIHYKLGYKEEVDPGCIISCILYSFFFSKISQVILVGCNKVI